jgi:hypothetical protein
MASEGGHGLSPGILGCGFPNGGPACLMHRTVNGLDIRGPGYFIQRKRL